MDIIYLSPCDIRSSNSKYLYCRRNVPDEDDNIDLLIDSIGKLGMLTPVLVHRLGSELHLIDGYKRLYAAEAVGLKNVPCHIIKKDDVSLKDILELLFINLSNKSNLTFADKVRFVDFAIGLGVKRETLIENILPLLGLKGHDAVLKKLEKIMKLPEDVLAFCYEKKFSMKQCLQLARYDNALLKTVFSWRDELALTAAVFEEMLANLNDYLRANDLESVSLLKNNGIKDILSASLSPYKKTEMMRGFIKEIRFPVLTGLNNKLESVKKGMLLPENVDVIWDKTLEKKEIKVALTICEGEMWEKTTNILKSEKVGKGIKEILNKL